MSDLEGGARAEDKYSVSHKPNAFQTTVDGDQEISLKQIRGEDVPPCLLGYFPYAPVSRVVKPGQTGQGTWSRIDWL
jgi:hypothetical protein